MTHILYGAPVSLFSGKARAYLDWKGVDYREELARREVHEQVIVPGIGRPVIPVVKLDDGSLVQDTTLIIDHFERAEDGPPVYPETPRQHFAALMLELYGDEWLVIPAMHYRWNYNEEWIYGEFGKTGLPDGSEAEQYVVGKEIGQRFRGFTPMLGVNETTIPAIETSYEQLLRDLDAHFAKHPYLFGTRPSIGDYGLIGPLYAHLYRDPKSGELMERIAPRVAEWVRRMVHVSEPLTGEFLADDEVPETLYPALARMMQEQLPNLAHTAELLGQWMQANDGDEPPRAVGMSKFTIEGIGGERMAPPYSLWMLQRALDYRASLDDEGRAACDALLAKVGGEALTDIELPARITFTEHRIRLER